MTTAGWFWGCFKERSVVLARLFFAGVERSQVRSGQEEESGAGFDAEEAEV